MWSTLRDAERFELFTDRDNDACRDDEQRQRFRHDVRQVTATVAALASVIDPETMTLSEASLRSRLLHREAQALAELVCDGAGRDRVIDASSVVSNVWESVASSVPCTVRLIRDPLLFVEADPALFGRAVRNLLDNAVRAAGPEGVVQVSMMSRHDEAELRVADSGPGFGRIEAQQGLGLETVKELAHRHGGHVRAARSGLGGALMILRLPQCPRGLEQDRGLEQGMGGAA